MALKHNKKRNTAFLFEILIKELAKGVMHKQDKKAQHITFLIKEYFHKKSFLYKELELFRVLNETHELAPHTAEKMIQEIKYEHQNLDRKKIFNEQSRLISKINKALSKNAFSNFVPNFKNLATISQIFNQETSIKSRVLLEETIFERLISKEDSEDKKNSVPINNLIYKTFINKFNEQYSGTLFEEQKNLLNNYVLSFSDGGIDLKIFLNEEIGRLRDIIKESLRISEIKDDTEMTNKTKKVLNLIENFKLEDINQNTLTSILKIQNLAREIRS